MKKFLILSLFSLSLFGQSVDYLTQLKNRPIISLKDSPYKAKGNGTTDDTAAIQAAINAGVNVFCPDGTYIVKPTAHLILSLKDNLHLFGSPNCTFKVGNSSGPYSYVFFNSSCNNCKLEGFTIDANVANNPIANLTEIQTYIRSEIWIIAASNASIKGVTIKNTSSANPIVLSDGPTSVGNNNNNISDCNIYNAGDDPNHIIHDSSGIFMWSTNGIISNNNIFAASGWNAPAANSGIEAHGPGMNIFGNNITGYNTGILFAGEDAVDDETINIYGNTLRVTYEGITLWSVTYSAHTTGFSLNGVNVTGNSIFVHQLEKTPLPNAVDGIIFYAGSNMASKNIHIDNNLVQFDQEAAVGRLGAGNYTTIGIGSPFNVQANFLLSGISVSNNTIENCPIASIEFNNVSLTSARIISNTIRNGGGSLDPAILPTDKTAIFLSAGTLLYDIKINNNLIIDDLATSVITYMLRVFNGSSTHGNIEILDNTVNIADVTHTSWLGYFTGGSNSSLPLIRMTTLFSFVPSIYNARAGSEVWDATINNKYFLPTDGVGWIIPHTSGRDLVNGDFVLSANWGTGKSIYSLATGSKSLEGSITINSGSAATVVYPTVTLTFPSPPANLTSTPFCQVTRNDAATINSVGYTGIISYAASTSNIIFRLEDLPIINTHYTINWKCDISY